MEDLTAELTMDILSRLPVKTIIHCKLVCKKWRDLVLDSFFVNLHLSRSPTGLILHHILNPRIEMMNVFKDPGFLKLVEIEDKVDHHHLHHDPSMTLHLNLAPILQNSRIQNMASVNGLICLWQSRSKLDNTYICNPITREYMILPRPRYYNQDFAIITYGFGVSSVTGEYKVVRTFQQGMPMPPNSYQSNQPSVLEAEVYTLGSGQWRSLGRVPYCFNGLNGPFLNDHCHWILCDKGDAPENLCSFDLNKETFQLFPSPPMEDVQGSGFRCQSLAVLKGCLCKLDRYESQFTIWVMKEYGIKKSWHKEVVFKLGVGYDVTLLIRLPDYLIEGLEDRSILISSHHKLLAYCPESDTIEDTQILDNCVSVLTYRPSFLKLHNFELERVQMF